MAEELARVEKPAVESFKEGRRLFFVPLIFKGPEPEPEYQENITVTGSRSMTS